MSGESGVADERTTTGGDARAAGGTAAARTPDVWRALALLVSSFLALVGIVTVAGVYVGLVASTARQTSEGSVPCLVAFSAGTDHAHVHYDLAPPRSVCTMTPVGGEQQRTVVAQGSTVLFGAGLALVAVGVAGIVVVAVRGRRARGR